MVQSDDFSKVANYVSVEGDGSEYPKFVTTTATSIPDDENPKLTEMKLPEEDEVAFELLLNRFYSTGEWRKAPSCSGLTTYYLWTSSEERKMLSDICHEAGLDLEVMEPGGGK